VSQARGVEDPGLDAKPYMLYLNLSFLVSSVCDITSADYTFSFVRVDELQLASQRGWSHLYPYGPIGVAVDIIVPSAETRIIHP
jgi:hypothetical protein